VTLAILQKQTFYDTMQNIIKWAKVWSTYYRY